MRTGLWLATVVLLYPLGALAQYDYEDDRDGRPEPTTENIAFAYADVLRVDPIYVTRRVREPREECYDTEVERRDTRGNNGAGTVIGAIVGGALGNQVGKGDGRKAATVAGALIGGAIGNNAARRDDRYYGEPETRCRTVSERYSERRIVGYDVAYELDGQQYQTRTANPPGRWIQVPAPAYGYAPQGYEQPAYPDAGYAEQVPPDYPVQPAYSNGYAQPYPQPYPQAYPQAYPAPAYPQSGEVPVAAAPVAYYPAPVVAPLPVPVPVPLPLPIGLNLSFGGVFGGGHHHGGWR